MNGIEIEKTDQDVKRHMPNTQAKAYTRRRHRSIVNGDGQLGHFAYSSLGCASPDKRSFYWIATCWFSSRGDHDKVRSKRDDTAD